MIKISRFGLKFKGQRIKKYPYRFVRTEGLGTGNVEILVFVGATSSRLLELSLGVGGVGWALGSAEVAGSSRHFSFIPGLSA